MGQRDDRARTQCGEVPGPPRGDRGTSLASAAWTTPVERVRQSVSGGLQSTTTMAPEPIPRRGALGDGAKVPLPDASVSFSGGFYLGTEITAGPPITNLG